MVKLNPRTVYLDDEELNFIKKNSIHFSHWVRDIVRKSMLIEKQEGKSLTIILEERIYNNEKRESDEK